MAVRIKHADICDSTAKYQDRVIMQGDSILQAQESRFDNLNTLSLSYKKDRDKARKSLKLFKSVQLFLVPVVGIGFYYLGTQLK